MSEMRDFNHKCENLLANKRDVAFISDLIVLDSKVSFQTTASMMRMVNFKSIYHYLEGP